jgi:Protein of unknown function (DUF1091)
MRAVIWLFLNILALGLFAKNKENYMEGVRYGGVECIADNTSITVGYCYTKPISRRHVTLNLKFNFVKPIESNFFLQVIINYRYGNVYRQVLNTKKMDFCGLMAGAADNLFFNLAVMQIGDFAKNIFHKCPYAGSVELKDFVPVQLKDNSSTLFPSGFYRYDVFFFVNDKEALTIKVFKQIKTSIKDTWG